MTVQLSIFGGAPEPVRCFEQDAYGFLIRGYGDKYSIFDGGAVVNNKTGKALAIKATDKGYLYVSLWHENKGHDRFVHRLLLQATTGQTGLGLEVNHKDGDKTNNYLSNLEWCTSSQNKWHSFHVLKSRKSILLKGSQNPNSKPVEGIDSSGKVVVHFESAEEARKCGYQPASIAHAIKGKLQKRHKGLFWRHAGNGTLAPGGVSV